MLVHMQHPQSEFQDVLECTRILLWSLSFPTPWFEFYLRYHDFMITREPGVNEVRFLAPGVWNVVTRELLVGEELE